MTDALKHSFLFGPFQKVKFTDFIAGYIGSIRAYIMRVEMTDDQGRGAGNLFDGVAVYLKLPEKSESSLILRSCHSNLNLFNPSLRFKSTGF